MNDSINSLDHAFEAAEESLAAAAEKTSQRAKSNLHEAEDSLSHFLGDMRSRSEEKFNEFNDFARETLQGARHRAEEFVSDTRVRVRSLTEDGEEFVRANPVKTVLGAMGAGLVLAFLVRK